MLEVADGLLAHRKKDESGKYGSLQRSSFKLIAIRRLRLIASADPLGSLALD